ncbi:hypothetical protein Tco_0722069 [Tanacetum coccineum]
MAPKRRTTRLNPGATPTPVTDTHTTTSVTNAQIQAMINEGVTAALAARDATIQNATVSTNCTNVPDRMFSREEIDQVEKYVGGLPDTIHGSVMATKPKTMQDAIEFATELMGKKINTWAERQADNKRKSDDTVRNNQNQ